jgi:hypothetical protein
VEQSLRRLRDPEADIGGVGAWIDTAFHKFFRNERSRWWLSFARSVDHASRYSLANPSFPDSERARIARKFYARAYPELDAMLEDGRVLAAVTAWRTRRSHWQAVRSALLDVGMPLPTARSMAQEWQHYPHLPHPRKTAGRRAQSTERVGRS